MKTKHEIPNKFDFMKAHSCDFIVNEKINTELTHENNVGKILYGDLGIGREKTSISKSHGSLVSKTLEVEQPDNFRRTIKDNSKEVIIDAKIDFAGSSPKRYMTKCYIKPVTIPSWYSESLLINLITKKQQHEESVFYKNVFKADRWSECMKTEIGNSPVFVSEVKIPVEKSDIHYISLPPPIN